jgi:hypothetical protein
MRDAEEKNCEYMIYFNILTSIRLQDHKRNLSCVCVVVVVLVVVRTQVARNRWENNSLGFF